MRSCGARGVHLKLQKPTDLDLAHALAGQVGHQPDLFERNAAQFGNIKGATVLELPRFPVWEVDLDRASLGVDV